MGPYTSSKGGTSPGWRLGACICSGHNPRHRSIARCRALRLGSLPDRSKHTPQTFDQVHDLALAMNVEVDFVISESRVIDGFLQTEQRLDHLSRQNETYPYADEQGDRGNDSERPLRFADELSDVGVILLDSGPVRRFKRSGLFENVLARLLETFGDLLEIRIPFLDSPGYLRVERSDPLAEFLHEAFPPYSSRPLQKVVEVLLIRFDHCLNPVGLPLPGPVQDGNSFSELLPVLRQGLIGFLENLMIVAL